jgi:hypothetical protein
MNSLWLRGRSYDLFFFQAAPLACLALLLPYFTFGSRVALPIYFAYVALFGLPHNYLTWASSAPGLSRGTLERRPIGWAFGVAGTVALALVLARSTELGAWIHSAIVFTATWHVYRQHHGICKVYDSVQATRSGDRSIFADRGPMNVFFALATLGVTLLLFVNPDISIKLGSEDAYHLIYPRISVGIFWSYLAAVALYGTFALKRAFWDRSRRGAFLPWPQLGLMATSLIIGFAATAWIPVRDFPLLIAILSIAHNIEYFGFVWLHDHQSALARAGLAQRLQPQERLASRGNWPAYFALALAFSLGLLGLYGRLPHGAGLFIIYTLTFAHYLADGVIWRHKRNRGLGPVIAGLARAGLAGAA